MQTVMRAEVAIINSDKKAINQEFTRDEEEYYLLVKVSIQQGHDNYKHLCT